MSLTLAQPKATERFYTVNRIQWRSKSMLKLVKILVAATVLSAGAAAAQDYPTKPVTLVVPFAPGGSSDLISRLVAQKLSESFKQQFIVENRAGGAGNIAMQAVARAAPDGYTLILGHIGVLAVNPAMFARLPYDPVKDFAPISMLATVPSVVVVNPKVPAKTLKEFIALAKAKPNSVTYGSAGHGRARPPGIEYPT